MLKNVRSISNDVKYGLALQGSAMNIFETHMGWKLGLRDAEEKYGKYSPFDYHSGTEKTWVEIKCRRIPSTKWKTTCIVYSKILWLKNRGHGGLRKDEDYYLVFKFTDGVFYMKVEDWVLDLKPSDTYLKYTGETKTNIYIPIDRLTRIQ